MGEAGRKPTVGDDEILRMVALSPDPIVTAPELAEKLDMTRQGVNYRLSDLVERGFLESRSVGSHAVVYWLTEQGRKRIAQSE